jgi:YHS domain-containing protein
VSGVVFQVTDASPHREVGGRTVYFCCESCARYFTEHAAQISAARHLAALP